NRPAWTSIGNPISDNILVEQYFLAACLEYHRHNTASPFRDVEIRYLFNSMDESFDEGAAVRAGYTHLIGPAKSNRVIAERLAARVERDYPALYEKCLRLGERARAGEH